MNFADMNFLDVTEFIHKHTHINYCEAIIDTDGRISYARPSHSIALESLTGLPREILSRAIPMYSSPLSWLIQYTGCIAVWSYSSLTPSNPTKAQLITLNILMDKNLTQSAKPVMLSEQELKDIANVKNGIYRSEDEFNKDVRCIIEAFNKIFK